MTDDRSSLTLATDPGAPPALALPLDIAPLVDAPIRTERLDLRPITLDDSDDIWQYQRLPEVLRYIPWTERDRDAAHAHTVRRSGTRGLAADGDAFDFAMVLRGEPTTRGTAAVSNADASAEASASGPDSGGGGVDGDRVAEHRVLGDRASDRGVDGDRVAEPRVLGDRASGDRVVGDVMLQVASVANAQCEIGWVLHPDFQGRGIAAEAASAVLRFAFETLHAHRVVAHLDVRNEASARLCERLGMRREAVLIEDEYDGGWQDSAAYALLHREWVARQG